MAVKQNKRTLKAIKAALKIFPKIVKEKEKAHRENEKILKNFASMSKKLKRITSKKAN